jgi:hypothetical protein
MTATAVPAGRHPPCHPPPDILLIQALTTTFLRQRMCRESVIAILSATQRRDNHESE